MPQTTYWSQTESSKWSLDSLSFHPLPRQAPPLYTPGSRRSRGRPSARACPPRCSAFAGHTRRHLVSLKTTLYSIRNDHATTNIANPNSTLYPQGQAWTPTADHSLPTVCTMGASKMTAPSGPTSRVCVCVAMPHAACGVHVQSIDDNTFRSDTPACAREERRVVSVGRSARGLHAENACVVSAGRAGGSARGRALPC